MSLTSIMNKVMSKYLPNTKKVARFIKEKNRGNESFQLEELLPLVKPQVVVIAFMSEEAKAEAEKIKGVILDLFPGTNIFLLPAVRENNNPVIHYTYELFDGELAYYYPAVSTTLLALPDLGLLIDENLTVMGFRPNYMPTNATYVYGDVSDERKAQLRKLDLDTEYPTEKMYITRELCGKDISRIVVLHDGSHPNFNATSDLTKIMRRILLCNEDITVVIKKHEALNSDTMSEEFKLQLVDADWVVDVAEKEALVYRVIDGVIEQEARGFLFLD